MTFPTLTCAMIPVMSDISDMPDDLPLNWDDDCFYFRVPVAESDDGRWLVTVDVGYEDKRETIPCTGVAPMDFMQFGYEITLFDQVDNVAYSTMDPKMTRSAIPEEIRPLVVEIACHCYVKLIPTCCPDYIFRTTWLAEPSENALKKHSRITEILALAEYIVVKEGTDKHGCKYWLLGNSDSDHSHLEPAGLLSNSWEHDYEPSHTL
jgi:hypothetical protein